MVALSLPFCAALLAPLAQWVPLVALAPLTQLAPFDVASSPASDLLAGIFLSFLVCDIVIGLVSYPSEIQLLTGYVHHAIYIYIILDFCRHGIGSALCPIALVELPTFVTRIVFHLYLTWQLFVLLPGRGFWGYTAATFPLHVWWLRGWWVRQLKLAKREREVSKTTSSASDSSSTTTNASVSASGGVAETLVDRSGLSERH
eukprot:jgi/Hompol1/3701/HPOL_000836-RA